jgi:predicted nucleic acid-binding protein
MSDEVSSALRARALGPKRGATLPDGTYGVTETPAKYVLLRPKVYVESSIPSYLKARLSRDPHKRRMQLITREWWTLSRWQFDVYWSDVVKDEIEQGDGEASRLRLDALEPFTMLKLDQKARALAGKILKSCRLPQRADRDAQHVAIAAKHNLEFLVTWNCAHLANQAIIPVMMHICIMENYSFPRILTPEQILGAPTHEPRTSE